ncbi:TonB-dependent receptor [Coralloluteibacterium stylophorae]|uniref:TonB-dependent receptor n=1 Tax=Coralloluteibacterium stylophorae TaxID=1776034 RepID=A0A8J8AYH0_9GAMM|nr:TonB-dependent receptor [Coralloluteibacterium stylophorae]MBS7456160.1 TonB-dependent receptor [Coralloluteibacterium stylophorae]
MKYPNIRKCALAAMIGALAPAMYFPTDSYAQSTSATLRGQVTAGGTAAANAQVQVRNTATGLSRSVTADAGGSYFIPGLPPGTYEVTVLAGGQAGSRTVQLRIGQTATLDVPVAGEQAQASSDATTLESITVTGTRIEETKTSEVANYVSQKQIDALPQASRNFLAFADTVPGVQFITSANGTSQLRSGAQSSNAINVFIDGVGQKNYVLKGGVSGQDQSRGNPFPQSAIGEYKVITSNYKAEYDQISGAAVTAVTKSGTNEFHGDFFWDRTADGWRASTPTELANGEKVESVDEQYGVTFGGPIVKDLLHFFVAYENKSIVSPRDVIPGESYAIEDLPPELREQTGVFNAPFDSDLYFGKLSLIPGDEHLVELTFRKRLETDSQGAGNGPNVSSFASNTDNTETRVDLRYQFSGLNWLNDAHLTYEDATRIGLPAVNEFGRQYTIDRGERERLVVLRTGGSADYQDKGQEGYSFQNDLSYFGLEGHTFKTGIKYKQVKVRALEQINYNPQYYYSLEESLTIPTRVEFGATLPGGNPAIESDNKQYGIYFQDDWDVTDRLTLNLGVRYDYEETPAYTDFETPPDLVEALRNWANIQDTDYDIEDYISTGSNRDNFDGAFAPRFGFSYDISEDADESRVIFGGAGRSYDRNLFDYLQLEQARFGFVRYAYDFNSPIRPCDPATQTTCVNWDESFYDPAALAELAAANPNVGGEIDLLNNDLKVPYSDQFSLGIRDTWGDWNVSGTISHVESKDGVYYRLGNRFADGEFRDNGGTYGGQPWGQPIPGYGSLILLDNGVETRLNSVLLSAEKPYTEASGWGVTFAYTYSDSSENRQNAAATDEHYFFDYPTLEGQPFYPSIGIPKHRLVATGIYDLPWGITGSAKLVLATPNYLTATNCYDAPDNANCFFESVKPDTTFGQKQLDLALEKVFYTGTDFSFRIRGDVFNVTNARNYTSYETWKGDPGVYNEDYLTRNGDAILLPTRTFKLTFGMSW